MQHYNRIRYCLLLLAVIFAAGCKIYRPAANSHQEKEIVTVRDTVMYIDTFVIVELVPDSKTIVSIRTDTSYLSTDYAESFAWYDGFIHHSLSNLPGKIKADVTVPRIVHTESLFRSLSDTIYVDVERDLTSWQNFRMTAGDISLCLLAVCAIFICVKKSLL